MEQIGRQTGEANTVKNVSSVSVPRERRATVRPDFDTVLAKLEESSNREMDSPSVSPVAAPQISQPIFLGTITQERPTVSHLLINHPDYRKDCWRIIHGEQNRAKPYTRMRPGTAVFINPESLEISWQGAAAGDAIAVRAQEAAQLAPEGLPRVGEDSDSFSARLAEAVEPYFGKSYEEMDCYELLVKGLKSLGIRYSGSGGLRERLVTMARTKGMPGNTYLNGEGLVEASGTKLYSRFFLRIHDAAQQARQVLSELEPFLEKGAILSFSTPTRGHTGIVSRKDNTWTFINSGLMDHNLRIRSRYKAVGEESLEGEIKNWFKLAAGQNEALRITVGRLDAKKLIAFRNDRSPAAFPAQA